MHSWLITRKESEDGDRRGVEFPDASVDAYEQVFEVCGKAINAQPKRLQHVCYPTGDVGFVVVDVWEDEASFAAFGDVIGPAIAQVGLEASPKVFPLQGYTGADRVRNP